MENQERKFRKVNEIRSQTFTQYLKAIKNEIG